MKAEYYINECLVKLLIPLPPLDEQARIVTQLDGLLEQVNILRTNIKLKHQLREEVWKAIVLQG